MKEPLRVVWYSSVSGIVLGLLANQQITNWQHRGDYWTAELRPGYQLVLYDRGGIEWKKKP